MSGLLSACERAVERGQRRGFPDCEVFALEEEGSSVEFEKGSIAHAEWGRSQGFGVRVHVDGRVGFAYATEAASIAGAFEAAKKAARLGRPLPKFRFAGQGPVSRLAGLEDARVANLDAEGLLGSARRALSAVADVRKDLTVAGGGLHAGRTETAISNSEGLSRSLRETGLGVSVYVVQNRDGVSTGFASQESHRLGLEWERIGKEAGDLAVSSSRPKPLEKPGRRDLVLRPDPASDLLTTVTIPSLYGRPAHRGESHYTGKVGKRIVDPKISLFEDPTLAHGLGSSPFDDEGTPCKRRAIISRGVLKGFLYDAYDGAEYGHGSTASAVRSHAFDGRSYKSAPSTSALQVDLVAPRTTTARLVRSVDDGLLVHDLMGVHTANVASGDFSVTSSVLFRIRKGAVEGPVAPVSIGGNFHKILRKGLRLGDDPKALGGSPALTLPSMLIEGLSVAP